MNASVFAVVCIGLMRTADMPFALTTAQPILDFAFAFASLAFAMDIEVLELECPIAT